MEWLSALLAAIGAGFVAGLAGSAALRALPERRRPQRGLRRLLVGAIAVTVGAAVFATAGMRGADTEIRIGTMELEGVGLVLVERGAVVTLLEAGTGELRGRFPRCGRAQGVLAERWLHCSHPREGASVHDLRDGARVARGSERAAWMARQTGAPIERVAWMEGTLRGWSREGLPHAFASTHVPAWSEPGAWWGVAEAAESARLVRASHAPVGPPLVEARVIGEDLYRALVVERAAEPNAPHRLSEWHADGTRGWTVEGEAWEGLASARGAAVWSNARWHVALDLRARGDLPSVVRGRAFEVFTFGDGGRLVWRTGAGTR